MHKTNIWKRGGLPLLAPVALHKAGCGDDCEQRNGSKEVHDKHTGLDWDFMEDNKCPSWSIRKIHCGIKFDGSNDGFWKRSSVQRTGGRRKRKRWSSNVCSSDLDQFCHRYASRGRYRERSRYVTSQEVAV